MILSVENVSFTYPGRPVLTDATFNVGRGEFIALLGTNGAGKTTLLKCLNRILKPQSGAVCLDEQEVGDLTRRELAQKMGYVEQQRQGSRTTVFDAVLMGRKPYIRWEATRRDLAIVDQILTRLELSAFALRFLDELSGGELQKVTIARALAQQPKVLLMDEPTSSLDLKNQLEVLALTREICQSGEISVVAAMHDLNLALRFADRFILLKDGEVFIAGGKEIITAETLHTVYGVSVAVENYNDNKVIIPLV